MVSWLFEMDRPNDASHVFVAIDPGLFGGAPAYGDRMEGFLDRIHGVPLADGVDEVLHPGQLEWRSYDRAVGQGLSLPRDVLDALEATGEAHGVRVPWAVRDGAGSR